MEDWLSASQLALKGDELDRWLGIPSRTGTGEWRRYPTEQALEFRRILKDHCRRVNEQTGSRAWPATPENIERFAIAMARRQAQSKRIADISRTSPSVSSVAPDPQSSHSPLLNNMVLGD